jgi:hypothetical protein
MSYVNGSDLLVYVKTGTGNNVARKAIGHCTTHTATFNTETKDVAVKPPASEIRSAASLYKQKRITGLSVQVKCSGLCFYAEDEGGFKHILGKWAVGDNVELELFERPAEANASIEPYASGAFVISSLENTAPAGEDATYDVTFDNNGPVSVDDTKISL